MTNRVLVTGGAGRIGSDLVGRLLERGAAVAVLDNLSSGKREDLRPFEGRPEFRCVEGDLLDFETVLATVDGTDLVYHLAANPDVKYAPGDATDEDLKQNTLGTYHVLEAMRRRGVRRLAFASTAAVYGPSERQPIPEDQPRRPISLYGATKLGREALIGAFQNLFGLACRVFRFATIVGPKVRKVGRTVVDDFILKLRQGPSRLQILGNGLRAKSYLLSAECVGAKLIYVGEDPW